MLSCESSYIWSPFLGEFPEVIYERKENRNTEQDDSIPERSQRETSSTSVYQEPQSNEDLQNNDADCNLKDDSSSYDHKSNDQSKFVFILYLTTYSGKLHVITLSASLKYNKMPRPLGL